METVEFRGTLYRVVALPTVTVALLTGGVVFVWDSGDRERNICVARDFLTKFFV
jgi:hypothetical protein